MAYSTSEGPYLVSPAVAGGANVGSSRVGGNVWAYRSTHARATVITTGFFSDGDKRGMRVGDLVHVIVTSTAYVPTAMHTICVSSVSTNGATAAITGSSA